MQLTTCLNHHNQMLNVICGEFLCGIWADGGFRPSSQNSNKENWPHGLGNKGQIYGMYNREGHYFWDGNYNRDNTFNRGNYGNKNDRIGPHVPSQNREVTSRDSWDSMVWVQYMLHKMMRRFDASDEKIEELRSYLAGIG